MGEAIRDRGVTRLLAARGYILSPKQQISLHFRCLVREHKFSKLAWHFRRVSVAAIDWLLRLLALHRDTDAQARGRRLADG